MAEMARIFKAHRAVELIMLSPDPNQVCQTVYALEPTKKQSNTMPSMIFPPCQAETSRGERADYLPKFTRAVGGKVALNRRCHTARARIFGGSKATRTHGCTVLLNTRSPSTFSQRRIWQRMLGREAASENGLTDIPEWKWGVSMVYL